MHSCGGVPSLVRTTWTLSTPSRPSRSLISRATQRSASLSTSGRSRGISSFTWSVITPSSSAAVGDWAPIGPSVLERVRCGGNANCDLLPHLLDRQPSTGGRGARAKDRSEEHTYELQSLMRNSYDVFCLKHKTTNR